jgi:antitoxin StbD
MSLTHNIHAKTTVSLTELRRNPRRIMEIAKGTPVAVLNHNKLEAYLLSAKAYEALLDLIDDITLMKNIRERKSEHAVKVQLTDL